VAKSIGVLSGSAKSRSCGDEVKKEQPKSQPEDWPLQRTKFCRPCGLACGEQAWGAAVLQPDTEEENPKSAARNGCATGVAQENRSKGRPLQPEGGAKAPHLHVQPLQKKNRDRLAGRGRNDPSVKKTSAGGGNSLWRGSLRGETEQRGILLDDSTVLGGSRKCRGPSGRVAGAFP